IAVAAAEVVAMAVQSDSEGPSEIGSWIRENRCDIVRRELVESAVAAIDSIRERSELAELWRESGQYGAWCDVLEQLKKNLINRPARPRPKVQKIGQRAVKFSVGDVVQLRDGDDVIVVQIVAVHRRYGPFVRIVKGLFESLPMDWARRVGEPGVARVFCMVQLAFDSGQGKVVGREKVPSAESRYPLFLTQKRNKQTGLMEDVLEDLNTDSIVPLSDGAETRSVSAIPPSMLIAWIRRDELHRAL
ncbi:MAG: DUF4259 domain-containing protein, partial [Thermoanaerobaculia bacterium]